LKIANYSYNIGIYDPCYGWCHRKLQTWFGSWKILWWGYQVVTEFDNMLNCSDTIRDHNGQTDRHVNLRQQRCTMHSICVVKMSTVSSAGIRTSSY